MGREEIPSINVNSAPATSVVGTVSKIYERNTDGQSRNTDPRTGYIRGPQTKFAATVIPVVLAELSRPFPGDIQLVLYGVCDLDNDRLLRTPGQPCPASLGFSLLMTTLDSNIQRVGVHRLRYPEPLSNHFSLGPLLSSLTNSFILFQGFLGRNITNTLVLVGRAILCPYIW